MPTPAQRRGVGLCLPTKPLTDGLCGLDHSLMGEGGEEGRSDGNKHVAAGQIVGLTHGTISALLEAKNWRVYLESSGRRAEEAREEPDNLSCQIGDKYDPPLGSTYRRANSCEERSNFAKKVMVCRCLHCILP